MFLQNGEMFINQPTLGTKFSGTLFIEKAVPRDTFVDSECGIMRVFSFFFLGHQLKYTTTELNLDKHSNCDNSPEYHMEDKRA